MGSATGGTEWTRPPPTKKLRGHHVLYTPSHHDGSDVTVIIPALNRPLDINACLFLAVPTARLFHQS